MVTRLSWIAVMLLLGGGPRAHAQAPVPPSTAPVAPDTLGSYATPALRTLVADAVRANARLPEGLRGYRAVVETEMSVALRDSATRERTTQLEQVASEVRWRAPDWYDQRVIGYRNQALGPTFSLMSIFGGWTTPTLYGNRLRLGVTPASTGASTRNRTTDASLAIHPLAEARDRYYRFEGGDTVATLHTRSRRIPVVRLVVRPRETIAGDAILFAGDVDLDGERRQVVRMRGRLVEFRNGRQTTRAGSRLPGASGASFVELVNAEVDGRWWLPAYQRTELQANIALFGDFRTLVRIVSRFRDMRVNDSTWTTPLEQNIPSRLRHTLSFAPTDSLGRYADWSRPLGQLTETAAAEDFDDLAPAAWRTTGQPTVRFRPRSISEVFRFNRVEGAFTGAAVEYDPRDHAPGLSLRAHGGWAWSESTARGALIAERSLGRWTHGLRLERQLATTNDFRLPLASSATWSALLGSVDDHDYVDRWSATAMTQRALGLQRRSFLRLEVGPGRDRAVTVNASRGLFESDSGFRPVRGIHEGDYLRTVATLEWNPQVSALFLDRGVGGRLRYDRADGHSTGSGQAVRWQRLEARLVARRAVGPFHLIGRADGGMLLGPIAPQALFEIGKGEGLSAYEYKEFGGDRAAIARALVGYDLPWLRAPIILPSRLIIPGLAPGISVGVQGGWAEASSERARTALAELGAPGDTSLALRAPPSRPTDGIRATADLRLTFFSGAASIGMARAIDRPDRWKFVATLGQAF